MAANAYTSLPLKTWDTIRLLNIDQGVGDFTCRLTVHQIDQAPKFDALSYARDVFNRTVRCDGHNITISENCYQALLHLRKVKSLTIWVDAVCMQESEKRHHVQLTQAIYSGAANVYIWLGTGNASTIQAMTFLSTGGLRQFLYIDGDHAKGEISRPMSVFWRLYRSPKVLSWSDKAKTILKLKFYDSERTVSLSSLEHLLGTVWNTRLWTFSEAILATNPIVVSGDQHLNWEIFSMAVSFIHHTNACQHTLQETLLNWAILINSKEHYESKVSRSQGVLWRYKNHLRGLAKIRHRVTVLKGWLWFLLLLAWIPWFCFKTTRSLSYLHLFILGLSIVIFSTDSNLSLGKNSTRVPLTEETMLVAFLGEVKKRKITHENDIYSAMQCVLKQLLERDMPAVDNKKDAYRELTSAMMEIVGAETLIEAAARDRLATGPTWVPNWSNMNHEGILGQAARLAGYNATTQAVNIPRCSTDSITVAGIHSHTLTEIRSLQATQADYELSEHEIHVRNYRIVHAMVMAGKGGKYTPHNKELKALKIGSDMLVLLDRLWADTTVPTDLSAKHLVTYIQHFQKIDVEAVGDPTVSVDTSFWPPWTNGITDTFRVHMTLCRLMIRHHLVFFRGIRSEQPDQICYGVCLTNAAKGDGVMLVKGAKLPLIMRPRDEKKMKEKHSKLHKPRTLIHIGQSHSTYARSCGNLERFRISIA